MDRILEHRAEAQRWAKTATEALQGFWRRDHFWRDTNEATSSSPQPYYPTATFAVVAAVLGNRVAPEEAGLDLPAFLKRLRSDGLETRLTHSSLATSSKQWNLYTAAMCFEALTLVHEYIGLKPHPKLQTFRPWLESEARKLRPKLLTRFREDKVARQHPFLAWSTFRSIEEGCRRCPTVGRGLTSAQRRELGNTAQREAERIVATHAIGGASPADLVALTYYATILSELSYQEHQRLVEYAINAVCRSQSDGGVWPMGRSVLPATKSSSLHISSFDIGRTIVRLAVRSMVEGGASAESLATRAEAFQKLLAYVGEAYRRVRIYSGWVDDLIFRSEAVESWSTAIALDFLKTYSEYAQEYINRQVLARYDSTPPAAMGSWVSWADLLDPDPDHSPIRYIDEHFLAPLTTPNASLPSKGAKNISLLLFGPPGTSKTSVVKALAKELGWPFVTITPGLFMAGESGVNGIDARATAVFADLRKLRKVVILFDECDELFRVRSKPEQAELLSQPALITGAMLPRLQNLHDDGGLVFAIATNRVSAIDQAVRREGRIDHIVAVGPPELKSRLTLLEGNEKARHLGGKVRRRLADKTERRTRDEILRIASALPPKATARQLTEALALGEPDIDEVNWNEFKKERARYSRPHLEVQN